MRHCVHGERHTTHSQSYCYRVLHGWGHSPAGWRREPQHSCTIGPNEVLDNALLHGDVPTLVAYLNVVVHIHTYIQFVQSVGGQ